MIIKRGIKKKITINTNFKMDEKDNNINQGFSVFGCGPSCKLVRAQLVMHLMNEYGYH